MKRKMEMDMEVKMMACCNGHAGKADIQAGMGTSSMLEMEMEMGMEACCTGHAGKVDIYGRIWHKARKFVPMSFSLSLPQFAQR